MTEAALQQYIQAIRPADRAAMDAARKRQAELAKPPGSLGALEDMSIRLAGITGQVCPKMDSCRVAVFAADNGVVDEGVSCAPRSVTLQQAINMTRRRTGMSAMAAAFGDDVAVVDVGIAADVPDVGILDRKVRRGTGNIAVEDAMTRPEALAAMAGAFLGCARERIPAAVDGFISVVAALCAVTLCPEVRDYLFLSHDSYEVGYRLAADRLGLEPCLHLGMRLGEGSGCPLLFRVLEGACGVMAGMATFAQAAIQDDYLDEIRAGDSFTVDKP